MTKNSTLVGVFVKKRRILSFLESLRNDQRIPIRKIYVYTIEGNKGEYLTTFNIADRDQLSMIKGASIIHTKNGCLFTINALNKLVDRDKGNQSGDNRDFEIDWENYRNKLIMTVDGELSISSIKRIEDKGVLLY